MPDETPGELRWVWFAALGCAVVAAALLIAFYLRHDERSFLADFTPAPKPDVGAAPLDASAASSNGSAGGAAPEAVPDVVAGEEAG